MFKRLLDFPAIGNRARRRARRSRPHRADRRAIRRALSSESLERRLLLASDVTIGNQDIAISYTRIVNGNQATYSPINDGASIGGFVIASDLNNGLSVIVDTVNASGTQEGNLFVATGDLTQSGSAATTLHLRADSDLLLQSSSISSSGGPLNVILNSDRDDSGAGRVEIDIGSEVITNGGDVTIGGGIDPNESFAIGTTLTPAGVSIFGNIQTQSGNVSIRGRGRDDSGPISDADGVRIEGTIDTDSGNVSIVGIGGDTPNAGNDGVSFDFGVVASTSGAIAITGFGGGSGSASNGVLLSNSALVAVSSGSIRISGTAAAAGSGIGVALSTDGDVIESLGSAPITITGNGSGGADDLQSLGAIGGVTAAGDITLNANTLTLSGVLAFVEGVGNLRIRPTDPATSIGLGGGAGTLNLSDAELAMLSDGFASITVGDVNSGSGLVSIDSADFADPVTIVGGSINVTGGMSSNGGIALTALDNASDGQSITIDSGLLDDASGDVALSAGDAVNIASTAGISAPGGSVTIQVDPAIGNADATGGVVVVDGTISAATTPILAGGDDADSFQPLTTSTALNVIGGSPTNTPGDRLLIDAADSDVIVSDTSIQITGSPPIGFNGIETIELENASSIQVVGDLSDDAFALLSHPTNSSRAILSLTSGVELDFATASVAGLSVSGNAGSDTLTIDINVANLPAINFMFDGGSPSSAPGDQLVIEAGGVDVDIDAATGIISLDGLQDIVVSNTESIALSNVGDLTVVGSDSQDLTILASNPALAGTDLLTINSRTPVTLASVAKMTFNGGGGDDQFVYDANSAMPVTPAAFNGQGQALSAGGDRLTIRGSFGSQTLNYDAAGSDGNNGSVDLDGTLITYTGLEPIDAGDSVDTVVNFNTAAANDARITSLPDPPDTLLLFDNGNTFENTTIPNPSGTLAVNLGDAGDTLEFSGVSTSFAASVIVSGGAGSDTVLVDGLTLDSTPGRALDVAAVESLTITDSTFRNNVAEVGGGLRVDGGTTVIDNSSFIGNVATGDAANQGGGGIYANGDVTIENSSLIDGNSATGLSGSGGGILVGPSGTLTVRDSTIGGNIANRAGGGVETQSGNDLNLENVSLTNNVAGPDLGTAMPGNGGGLHVTGDASVTLSAVLVQGNTAAAEGGGLWNDLGTMTINDGVTIESNTASGDSFDEGGGGIFNNGGTLIVQGSTTTIHANVANGSLGSGGGILSVNGGSVSIDTAAVTGNSASNDGGGIAIFGIAGSLSIQTALIENNTASDLGGGIFVVDATTTISESDFSGNTSDGAGQDGAGGGLFISGENGGGGFTITDSTFDQNTAFGGGAAAEFVDADGTISGSSFTSNTVFGTGNTFDTGGGALAVIGASRISNVTISGSTFDGNTAPTAGAIGVVDSRVMLNSSTVSNNQATLNVTGAGGIGVLASFPVTGDLLTITQTTISGNSTNAEAGGLGILDANVLVIESTIMGNSASGGRAGGIGIAAGDTPGTLTIRRSTIADNTASGDGGGIGVADAGIDLVNVTIAGNQSFASGGGIAYNSIAGSLTRAISFTTIASNIASSVGPNLAAAGQPLQVTATIVSDGDCADSGGAIVSLGGNVASGTTCGFNDDTDRQNTDPLLGNLQDNGGLVPTIALQSGSPAIDQGGTSGPDTDARGVLRPIDGDSDGSLLWDSGAFEAESVPSLTIADVVVNEADGVATVTVQLSQPVSGGVSVDYSTSAIVPAIAPDDYSDATGTLNFIGNSGETQSFVVTIAEDNIVEPDESFLVALSNPSQPGVDVSNTATVTITDNDTATLSIIELVIDEELAVANIQVMVDAPVQGGFTVEAFTADGTATAPDDYTAASQVLTFSGAANETQTFSVAVIDEMVIEPLETFAVGLQNASLGSIDASDIGTVSIRNADVGALTVADVSVDEGSGSVTITVSLDNPVQGGFTVPFQTVDGTAIAPADYADTSGVLTFVGNAGESQQLTVTIVDDGDIEESEFFDVQLSPSTAEGALTVDTGRVTILDDDLQNLRTITGHLFCDANANDTEEAGEAAVGIEVFLDRNNNGQLDAGEPSTNSDSTGDFRFDNVTDPQTHVTVQIIPGCNTVSAEPLRRQIVIDVGFLANSIVSADIDGDSDRDLLVTADLSHSLAVLENNGGNFTRTGFVTVGERPQSVFAYEDGLNAPLFAVASIGGSGSRGEVLLLESSDLTLAEATHSVAAGNGPIDALLDDFDQDGLADLVAGSFRSSDVTVSLSSQSGQMQTLDTDAGQVFNIASGNIDELGTANELVVAGIGFGPDRDPPRVEVFSLDLNGAFQKTASLPSTGAVKIGVQDVTGDDLAEVIALSPDGSLTVHRFSGRNFTDSIVSMASPGATSFALGDFNGDQLLDAAVANKSGQFVEILVGNGQGAFQQVTTIDDVKTPTDLVVDDFNGDGIGDIAVANFLRDAGPEGPNSIDLVLPSSVTLLIMDVATRNVVVTTNTVANFDFPTADPDVLFDVNGDNLISAFDALLVINALGRLSNAQGESVGQPDRGATDVNGDGRTSAIDALMIINRLGRAAEAESVTLDDVDSLDEGDDERDDLTIAIDLILSSNLY